MTLPVYRVDPDELAAERITLAGDEGRHAVVVRRTRPGEHVMLCDGSGRGAECEVTNVGRQSLVADVRRRVEEAPPVPELWVAQAIPKGDHADRAVDLLTEVGADRILPWAATRNVVTWRGDRAAKGVARWRATAAAAAKQSRRLRWPQVDDVTSTPDLVRLVPRVGQAHVLHEQADPGPVPAPGDGPVLLIVGPEGGVTDDELTALVAGGARPWRLGPTVLRSSTAGVVGAAVLLSRCRW